MGAGYAGVIRSGLRVQRMSASGMKFQMIYWAIAFIAALVVALLNANAALTIGSIAVMVVSGSGLLYGWYAIRRVRKSGDR